MITKGRKESLRIAMKKYIAFNDCNACAQELIDFLTYLSEGKTGIKREILFDGAHIVQRK